MAGRIRPREILRLRSVNGLRRTRSPAQPTSRSTASRTCWRQRGSEWPLDKPDSVFSSMLLEPMELRRNITSTVFCIQLKKKDWHPRLGGGVHTNAVKDRIVHNAVRVSTGEANMRQHRDARRQ